MCQVHLWNHKLIVNSVQYILNIQIYNPLLRGTKIYIFLEKSIPSNYKVQIIRLPLFYAMHSLQIDFKRNCKYYSPTFLISELSYISLFLSCHFFP